MCSNLPVKPHSVSHPCFCEFCPLCLTIAYGHHSPALVNHSSCYGLDVKYLLRAHVFEHLIQDDVLCAVCGGEGVVGTTRRTWNHLETGLMGNIPAYQNSLLPGLQACEKTASHSPKMDKTWSHNYACHT